MDFPSSSMVPPDGRVNPVTASTRVVLPAPLGPISPVICPGTTVSDTSSTASVAP